MFRRMKKSLEVVLIQAFKITLFASKVHLQKVADSETQNMLLQESAQICETKAMVLWSTCPTHLGENEEYISRSKKGLKL